MLIVIASYIIAIVCLALAELVFSPVSMGLLPVVRTAKRIAPIITVFLDATKITVMISLAVWLIRLIGGTPSYLMFIIPGLMMYGNDQRRIRVAKQGASNVRMMLEAAGEAHSYNQELDIRTENAHLIGDLIGWITGISIWLQSAPFF